MRSLSAAVLRSNTSLLRHAASGNHTKRHLSSVPSNLPEKRDETTEVGEDLSNLKYSTAGLSKIDEYREDFGSIARGIFVGHVDKRIFSYPEVLPNDRLYALNDRCTIIGNELNSDYWLDQIGRMESTGSISDELQAKLKSLGLYGMNGTSGNGGQGLYTTEMMRVYEELSVSFALANRIMAANVLGSELISQFASEDLRKTDLIQRLSDGSSVAAYCLSETPVRASSDPNDCLTTASVDSQTSKVTLNGRKTWISSGDVADVYIVSAMLNEANSVPKFTTSAEDRPLGGVGAAPATVTAFVVDASTIESGTIRVEDVHNPVGLRGSGFRTVEFEDVVLPSLDVSVLNNVGHGSLVLAESVLAGKMFVGSFVAAILRRAMNATLAMCLQRTSFGRDMIMFDRVNHNINRLGAYIYALESMSYMTAGLDDIMLHRDVDLEGCMVKLFASEAAKFCSDVIVPLWGARAYESTDSIARLKRDLDSLILWPASDELLHLTVSLKALHDEAANKKVVNCGKPIKEPFLAGLLAKIAVRCNEMSAELNDKVFQGLRLYEFVHPSFKETANAVEEMIMRLERAKTRVLKNDGVNIHREELALCRLSKMAVQTYAALCSLARGHRAYTHGVPQSEVDLNVAAFVASQSYQTFRHEYNDIMVDFFDSRDLYLDRISDLHKQVGSYAASHPLTRTMF